MHAAAARLLDVEPHYVEQAVSPEVIVQHTALHQGVDGRAGGMQALNYVVKGVLQVPTVHVLSGELRRVEDIMEVQLGEAHPVVELKWWQVGP